MGQNAERKATKRDLEVLSIFGIFQFLEILLACRKSGARSRSTGVKEMLDFPSGEIPCAQQTSFDKINDVIVKSERGEFVRISYAPLVSPMVYSAHATAGDV